VLSGTTFTRLKFMNGLSAKGLSVDRVRFDLVELLCKLWMALLGRAPYL
jgi:hypothetical protein